MIRALVTTAALVVLAPSLAAAQDDAPPMVELSPKQIEYFQKATSLLNDDQHDTAIEYYKLALKDGEANVLYASLGRAYFKKGDCQSADDNYIKALSAPTVSQPPPDAVRQKIEEYRIGLRVECSGKLEVVCAPQDMEIRIAEGARRSCSEFPVDLPAGDYKVTAFAGGLSQDKDIKITGLETTSIEFSIDVPLDNGGGGKPVTGGEPSVLGTVGWVTAGAGIAVVLSAVVMDVTVLSAAVDDFEQAAENRAPNEDQLFDDASSLQTIVLATYVAGGALALTGVVMALLAPSSEQAPAAAPKAGETSVQPWLGPDGAGVQFLIPW